MKSLGFNYRLTDFQSALGLKQILNYKNNLKKDISLQKYINDLKNIREVKCMPYSANCSFFVFQIFCKKRDKLLKRFKEKNWS